MPSPLEKPALQNTAVLLVGHGTRDLRGQAEFLQTAAMLRERLPGAAVEGCFLELASPDIASGLAKLIAGGAGEIVVAPVLLFAAGHAKGDIPRAVAEAIERLCSGRSGDLPHVRWAEALDCHEQVLRLSARRFDEACGDSAAQQRMLIFVGRGTSDAEAIERVHEFARRRAALTPVGRHVVCFLAAASPTLEDAIADAQAGSYKHIIVQPHLLFHGRLAQEVRARVEQLNVQRGQSEPQWHYAEHLGPEPQLIDALVDRIVAQASRL